MAHTMKVCACHILFIVALLAVLPHNGGIQKLTIERLLGIRSDQVKNAIMDVGNGYQEYDGKQSEEHDGLRTNASYGKAYIAGAQLFSKSPKRPTPEKASVFGVDTRFKISSNRFLSLFPFSTAVKLSNGCSGILLSPKHVLTSAHCLHDGKRLLKGIKKLRAGKVVKPSKRNKKRKRKSQKRGQSDAPYFKWVRARKYHIPQEWPIVRNISNENGVSESIEHDYAVVELRKSLGKEYMPLGMLPDPKVGQRGSRIHFSAYDGTAPQQLLYRFCMIQRQTTDFLYQYCDAHEGASGSGMYVRVFDKKKVAWGRKVIGVFSGAQWLRLPDGSTQKYNAGVRITPSKFAQICRWVKGANGRC